MRNRIDDIIHKAMKAGDILGYEAVAIGAAVRLVHEAIGEELCFDVGAYFTKQYGTLSRDAILEMMKYPEDETVPLKPSGSRTHLRGDQF